MSKILLIRIDLIQVINSRSRSRVKFNEIVENIATVGLKKPITVSRREGEEGYDLVCGEGRLEAYRAKGETVIPAIVLDISLEQRLLRSLVENLTRRRPTGIELVRDLVALKERGLTHTDIAAQTGISDAYVTQILKLMEKGEIRLVAAVERGDIPLNVAIEIASNEDVDVQRSLQDGYDSGELRGKSLLKVRKIIEQRRRHGKEFGRTQQERKPRSTQDLVRTLRRETLKQEMLVKKSRVCEEQLRFVTSALKDLMGSDHFLTLVRAEKLDKFPKYISELVEQ